MFPRVALNREAMAHVGSAVTGRVNDLKVRVGDTVKKGDVLVLVESAELGEAQSDFLQKQTAVTVAESALEPARCSRASGNPLQRKPGNIAR